MAATLEDVIERLRAEGQLTRNTGTNSLKKVSAKLDVLRPIFQSIEWHLATQTKTLQETLEDQRRRDELDRVSGDEEARPPREDGDRPSDAFRRGEELGQNLFTPFFGLTMGLGTLLAGATAVVAAIAGLRGWEGRLITSLTSGVSTLSDVMKNGLVSLRNSVLVRYFGFTAETADDVVGPRGPTISEQIRTRVSNLRTRALSIFGMGPDGRVTQAVGTLDDSDSLISRVTARINSLLSPLRTASEGISGFMTGAGKKIFDFFKPYIDNAAGFMGTVGKILKPLGILMSAFEGVEAFMNTEGTIFERTVAGLGAALGDFVGAPLDLIKNAIAWVIGKLFGIESTDGTYDESTVTGRVLNLVREFSFEDLIDNLVQAPFKFISNTWDWIKTLFTDPTTALQELWNGLVGDGGLLDILFTPVNLAIDWVTRKFGWREEDAPTFDLLSHITGVWANVRDTVVEKFQQLADYVSSVPDRVRLFAEGMFIDVSEKLQIGFTTLGAWIASIPARIKLMALNAIRSATSSLPEWAQIVSEADVAEAEQAVNSREAELESSINAIRASAAESRADLERRMAELDTVDRAAAEGAAAPVTIVQGGPVVAPQVQQTVRGGSSVQQNNFAGGGSDLDYGIPRGPQ